MKVLLLSIFILLVTISFSQTIFTNFDDFKEAASNAKPGDEIILAKGTYEAESITIKDVKGTESNPVIIRAENIGEVTLNNDTYIDLRHCSYITIQGFVINISEKSTTFKIQTCDHIRITQNILDGSGEPELNDDGDRRASSVWISIQSLWDDPVGLSHHNQIDHNFLRNKHTLGNMIRIDGTDEKYVSQFDVIEYNHFKNMGPRATNEMEAIRVGWSAMSESDGHTIVANNLFEECNGDPEIISVKCNKNTISHNTFRRCQGTLSLRHGNESVVEGNFFFGEGVAGTGGVRFYGTDHKIINNHFEGLTGTIWDAPITLTLGDAEAGNGSLSKHFRIERAIIANNTLVNNDYGIEVGYANNGKYTKPPRDIVLANNIISGSKNVLVKYITAPINFQWSDNIMYATGSAAIGSGVAFSTSEASVQNPNLAFSAANGFTKASSTTPEYANINVLVGEVNFDIEGQQRMAPFNYGADEFSSSNPTYKLLEAKDVGVLVGEFLYASKSKLDFPKEGSTIELAISSNLNWKVSVDQSWLHLSLSTGSTDGKVAISVDENTTGATRTATVLVESTNASDNKIVKNITISQSGTSIPFLSASVSELVIGNDGGSKEVQINSNNDWVVSADQSWIELNKTSGTINEVFIISAQANGSISPRNGLVSISGGGLNATIAISQIGKASNDVKLPIINAVASTEQTAEGNIAANVIDGILTNRWSGEGDGAFITLDMGEEYTVSYLKVGAYKSNERTSTFDILTSIDGVNFTEVLLGITSKISDEDLVIYDFNNFGARYIRIVGHGNSGSLWNSYTEFEAWGDLTTSNLVIDDLSTIKVFPNPATEIITIIGADIASVQVFSISGYEVMKSGSNRLNIEGLNKGVYILRINTIDGQTSIVCFSKE